MRFRSMIFVLTIAFSAIFVSMLGTSYAYYIATDGTTIDVTTSNMDTGVAVVFEQSQYVNVNTGIPIDEVDIENFASNSVFTITPDANLLADADVAVTISLMDVSIAEALRVSDFKYRLNCNDGTSDNIVNGNGTNFTDDVVSSGYLKLVTLNTTNNTFDASKTYTCTLSVWLQESGADQNVLMNKKFRGLIKVNTMFKKQ